MDFAFTEEQELMREEVKRMCDSELNREYVRWMDENCDFVPEELEEKVDAIINELATRSADALRMGKSVLNRSFEGIPWDAAMTIERNAIAWLYHSEFATNLRNLALAAAEPKNEKE